MKQIHKLMAGLINNQPANLHLVFGHPYRPPVTAATFARHGTKVTEIRGPGFTLPGRRSEIISPTKYWNAGVDPQIVEALTKRTEGWIVGLRLAALSLHGQHDLSEILKRFQGEPNAFVNEYLVSEVMVQLPEAIRDFMLKTSILDRLLWAIV